MRDRVPVWFRHWEGTKAPGEPNLVSNQGNCYRSEGKSFPNGDVTALKGKVSCQSEDKECHKVILKRKPPMRELLEGHKRVAASAQARNSREQSKKQALYKVSRRAEFSRVAISKVGNWWNFKQSQMIVGEILSSGIGGCSGSGTGGFGGSEIGGNLSSGRGEYW